MTDSLDPKQQWRQALGAGPDCLSVDQLSRDLSSDAQRHLDGCSRCQAELRMWQEFQNPAANEDEDVRDLVGELKSRLATSHSESEADLTNVMTQTSSSSWRRWAAAAVVVLAAGLVYGVLDREPGLTPRTDQPVYRGDAIDMLSPRGDVDVVPARLEWREVTGAVRYDVRVLEVDGTELWSASSSAPGVAIPPEVAALLVPGKTVSWDVSAVGQDGGVLIRSDRQQFRVQPPNALF